MRDHFRNEFLARLSDSFSPDVLNQIGRCFDETAAQYSISKEETHLTVIGRDEFLSLIKTYIVVKKMEGLSELTIRNYYLYLNTFVNAMHKAPDKITANDIRLYLHQYQSRRNISNRSLDKVRSSICAFFRWAAAEEYIPRSPVETIKPIKYEEQPRKSIDQIDLELMRRGCRTKRELAIIETFYSTGCRVSEIIGIKLDDINWITREVKVVGKGQKTSYYIFEC